MFRSPQPVNRQHVCQIMKRPKIHQVRVQRCIFRAALPLPSLPPSSRVAPGDTSPVTLGGRAAVAAGAAEGLVTSRPQELFTTIRRFRRCLQGLNTPSVSRSGLRVPLRGCGARSPRSSLVGARTILMSINSQEGKCINLILIPECNYIKPGSQVN